MHGSAEANERLVCAVLAAQVAAVRDRLDTGATVDLLWRTADVLARLSGLVLELAQHHPAPNAGLDEQCAAAVAAESEISQALDGVAFLQAQRDDLARQMADCIVTALERLAAADTPAGARLSPGDLAALYVCDDQRRVHAAVTRRFGKDASAQERPSRAGSGQQEGSGA
jgi:hypothetical protein